MKPSKILRLQFMVFILLAPAMAQEPRILTNSDIANMVKSGIGDQTIILSIQKASTKFDTSPEALIQLKTVGVSDAVLSAMLSTSPAVVPKDEVKSQECSQMLNKVISAVGPPEAVAALRSVRMVGTSTLTKPSGTTTLQVERITEFPSNIYISVKPSNGVGGMTVITPGFNYISSGKMTTALPATTLQEVEYGLKLDPLYIGQHRDQYGCVLMGAGKIGNINISKLEIEGEGVNGEFDVDPASARVLRMTYQSNPPTQTIADASDWRQVDGMHIPFKRHVVTGNATTDLVVTEYQINPAIDEALFQPPAGVIPVSVSLKVIQSESVPYTVQTNGGISTACNISGSTNTTMTASTHGNTTYGSATSTPNLQMNCKSTETTIRWTHVLNAMFVQASDGNAYIIACDRAWAWSKCTPLKAGDTFLATRGAKGFVVQSVNSKSKEQEATYSILQSRSLRE